MSPVFSLFQISILLVRHILMSKLLVMNNFSWEGLHSQLRYLDQFNMILSKKTFQLPHANYREQRPGPNLQLNYK